MQALHLSVGLPVRPRALRGYAGVGQGSEPEVGALAGSVVGQSSLNADSLVAEPAVGSPPERSDGDGLFIVEDLGVGEAGAVADGGVGEPVAGRRTLHRWCLSADMDAPAAASWDAGDLLDVDVDQLTWLIPLVATRRLDRGGPVSGIESAESLSAQDRLHRRRARPSSWPMWAAPHRCLRPSARRVAVSLGGSGSAIVAAGWDGPAVRRRLLEEPVPPFAGRPASIWNRSAVASIVQPCCTMKATMHRRPVEVSTAFGRWLLA